ncbi:hypothetical protein GCM10023331_15500 [Algivirga pacifica]|uniref:DUF4113 domain-containing protein n=1 Tax=Algivirga pacifica TaxID=1162670 RepID=A0ABP9D734_9BACT
MEERLISKFIIHCVLIQYIKYSKGRQNNAKRDLTSPYTKKAYTPRWRTGSYQKMLINLY